MKKYIGFLLLFFCFEINPQVIAFPGAEGCGKFTSGGRGGKVIEVTNLNDDGPGSLRNAVKQKGKRTVIFKISGTIELQSELEIKKGDLTIAGQTAPGDGICIKNYQTSIQAENVIIRFLRFRLGDEKKQASDALSIMNSKDIIIDHCSLSWGIDEVFSCYDNENTTVQWCIISEALNNSVHPKGEHGYGGIWGGKNATFHHNLFINNSSRNPRFNGSRTKFSDEEESVDFRNNVIHNWGINSSYGGEGGSYNIFSNYYRYGSASKKSTKNRIVEVWDNNGKWFIDKNFVYEFPTVTENNWNGGVHSDYNLKDIKVDKPFEFLSVNTDLPEVALERIVNSGGAVLPERDAVDARLIKQLNEKCIINNGIINSQSEVGGFPELISEKPLPDKDHDGMPDEWEIKTNLNPDDPEDRNIINENGYTNLEKYLNNLCEKIWQ